MRGLLSPTSLVILAASFGLTVVLGVSTIEFKVETQPAQTDDVRNRGTHPGPPAGRTHP